MKKWQPLPPFAAIGLCKLQRPPPPTTYPTPTQPGVFVGYKKYDRRKQHIRELDERAEAYLAAQSGAESEGAGGRPGCALGSWAAGSAVRSIVGGGHLLAVRQRPTPATSGPPSACYLPFAGPPPQSHPNPTPTCRRRRGGGPLGPGPAGAAAGGGALHDAHTDGPGKQLREPTSMSICAWV